MQNDIHIEIMSRLAREGLSPTGRALRGPAYQAIPVRTEDGRRIREAFLQRGHAGHEGRRPTKQEQQVS